MTFTTQDIAVSTCGILLGDPDIEWQGCEIDTRRDVRGKVFFALQGEKVDGHAFIDKAIEQGCAAIVASSEVVSSIPVIQVEDVRKALFQLALFTRDKLGVGTTIAITGSVGKTTTKDLLAQLLGEGVVASAASFNNDLGIPLTLLDAVGAKNLVVEVGANACGEIEPLAQLVSPDIAIITSIQKAHLEGFGSLDTILEEKVKLLESLSSTGIAIVPIDVPIDRFELECERITIGESKDANVRVRTRCDEDGRALLDIGAGFVTLQLLGKHNAMNAACAIVAAKYTLARQGEDVSLHSLLEKLANITGPSGRLRKIEICGVTFIDDTYNANPASMNAAVETFLCLKGRRNIAILGDMLELGDQCCIEHRRLGGYLSKQEIDTIFLVGPAMAAAAKVLPNAIHEQDASDEAMQRIASSLRKDDVVLLKGSRGIQLERIVEQLQSLQTKVSLQ